ncbi:16S rRNA (cytosine(967)-C(5))-methyltransferase RsmB [Desulfolithobacter sp.]
MKNTPCPRSLAIQVLVAWHDSREVIASHLDRMVFGRNLPDRDRQLAVRLVRGVLRQLQYLDRILARYSKTPPEKMKPLTLMALRVGILQLLFLDRVPASAAVNETVKALRRARQPRWLTGFVNGVLRRIAREHQEGRIPAPEKMNPPVHNHPGWLVKQWNQRFGGPLTWAICEANNREPSLCLRTNTLEISPDELLQLLHSKDIEAIPGRFSPDSIILPAHSGSVTSLPGFDRGLFQVQDEAAQLASLLLGPLRAGRNYLDGCAGLGGKSLHLASLLEQGAMLTALEPDSRRFRLLRENLRRLGLPGRVNPVQTTMENFCVRFGIRFSGILIDAPCSGTGIIRRQPDIRWNRQANDLSRYRKKQLQLLEQAATLLASGGVLVYTTCSLEPEENEEVIAAFLDNHPQFRLQSCRDLLPAAARELVDREGFFRPTPADGIDGFFGARMVRGDED